MKRGYPRPITEVKSLNTYSLQNPTDEKRWSNRRYPHPYTARSDKISRLHYGRLRECITFKRCIACGDTVEGESVWCYLDRGSLTTDSGPFHEKCKNLTKAMCPIVAKQTDRFSWEIRSWAAVREYELASFAATYGDCEDEPNT